MPTLYLVRHGEPATTGVLLGRTDPPLSDKGCSQMAALEVEGDIIFTSTLKRAHESARLCARGRRVVPLAELDELSHGEWDGLPWSEVERRWPDLAAAKLADWTGITPPGGEPWSTFAARIDRALELVRANSRPVAVVAHLAVNAWLAHRLSGADPTAFQQAYAEIHSFQFSGSVPPADRTLG